MVALLHGRIPFGLPEDEIEEMLLLENNNQQTGLDFRI